MVDMPRGDEPLYKVPLDGIVSGVYVKTLQ